MSIIEIYEYRVNSEVKSVLKQDLNKLTDKERQSITIANPKMYKELYNLVDQFGKQWEIIKMVTDINGIVKIKLSKDFDKLSFESRVNAQWKGLWVVA